MKYKVTTTATAVWHIYVDADSIDEAKDKVLEGEYDEKYDKVVTYINEEVHDILAVSLEPEDRACQ
jgi:hypothetical protein